MDPEGGGAGETTAAACGSTGMASSTRQHTFFLPSVLHPHTATEYKVLMGLHTGRVPEDLKAIYEELEATE